MRKRRFHVCLCIHVHMCVCIHTIFVQYMHTHTFMHTCICTSTHTYNNTPHLHMFVPIVCSEIHIIFIHLVRMRIFMRIVGHEIRFIGANMCASCISRMHDAYSALCGWPSCARCRSTLLHIDASQVHSD